MSEFKLVSPFKPMGDQVQAIQELVEGLKAGKKEQVLLGGTGTGKTFTVANVIKEYNKPSKDNYTKVINIKFDKKNEFKIESYRR